MEYSTHKCPGCQYLFQLPLCQSPYFSRTAMHFTIHSLQSLKASTGFGKFTWSELFLGVALDASLGSSSIHLSSALYLSTILKPIAHCSLRKQIGQRFRGRRSDSSKWLEPCIKHASHWQCRSPNMCPISWVKVLQERHSKILVISGL